MKNIILTREQIKKLNEITIGANANGQSSSEYTKTATSPQMQQDIQTARKTSQDVDAVISGPKSNDDSITVDVDVPAGSSVQNIMSQNQEAQSAINAGAKAKIHGDGFVTENTITKGEAEKLRLENIRKNGKKYTKQELFEMVVNEK